MDPLAALLVLTIVVMELAPDGEGTEEATAVTIFTLDPDQVTSLTWQYEEETISLEKDQENNWTYPADAAFPLDQSYPDAMVQALKEIPAVNAEIDGEDLIYKNYYHIGVAVGTDKGLVVPVVRDADQLSIAGIEKKIAEFGKRARDGSLKIEEMQGGTFTISNGGVYGSLMSTPILNAPQSGILGMHKIQERPMVIGGKIEIRPMMYLALSYDHRIVDGKGAVTFLVRVKEALEDPRRLLMDL